ncbi:MAG: hypothetical protein R3Y26_09150 [Rikenellaceae bacterium]
MKKIHLILVFIVCCSCMRNKTVHIESLASFNVDAVTNTGLNSTIGVNTLNDFSGKVKIVDAEVTVYSTGSTSPLITITPTQEIIIPKGSSTVSIPLEVEVKGGLLGSIMVINLLKNKRENLTISVNVHAKKGIVSANLSLENMTFEQFYKKFNVDNSLIDGLLNKI